MWPIVFVICLVGALLGVEWQAAMAGAAFKGLSIAALLSLVIWGLTVLVDKQTQGGYDKMTRKVSARENQLHHAEEVLSGTELDIKTLKGNIAEHLAKIEWT